MTEGNKSKPITSFKDLVIWKTGKELAADIYRITQSFPQEERFGLTDQMRRTSVSIPSNIAEGFNRKYSTDYKKFLYMALGFCGELDTQLEIALMLRLTNPAQIQKVVEKISHESGMLRKLLKKIEASIKERKGLKQKTSFEAPGASPDQT